jgi:hypothetical protein
MCEGFGEDDAIASFINHIGAMLTALGGNLVH